MGETARLTIVAVFELVFFLGRACRGVKTGEDVGAQCHGHVGGKDDPQSADIVSNRSARDSGAYGMWDPWAETYFITP